MKRLLRSLSPAAFPGKAAALAAAAIVPLLSAPPVRAEAAAISPDAKEAAGQEEVAAQEHVVADAAPLADQAPDSQTDPVPATEAAPAPAGEVKAEVDPADESEESKPTRLKPGGIDTDEEKGFPLSMVVSNSVAAGSGFLATGNTFMPSLWQSLTLRPSLRLPTFDVLPRSSLSLTFDAGIQWMSTYDGAGVADRLIRLSDMPVSLVFPSLFKEEFTNISVSPSLSVVAPLSPQSRFLNRFAAVNVGVPVSWSAPELPWGLGNISLTYTASGSLNGYTRTSPTVACGTQIPAELPITSVNSDPINGVDQVPLAFPRSEEYLGDGTCILSGRQPIAAFGNAAAVNWSFLEKHSLSASGAWRFGFLRPTAEDDASLHSPFANPGGFTESLQASLVYSYAVPLELEQDVSLSAGLSSGGASLDMSGNVRLPFTELFGCNVREEQRNGQLLGSCASYNMSAAFIGIDVSL